MYSTFRFYSLIEEKIEAAISDIASVPFAVAAGVNGLPTIRFVHLAKITWAIPNPNTCYTTCECLNIRKYFEKA